MEQNKYPTEIVDLPSKGLLYPESSPLSSGTVEMKYMTAKEEDILTNQNYIESGVVIDKLIQSLIVDRKVTYSDLLIGDKNALLVAARILGYGKDYQYTYGGITHQIDLSQLENKNIDETLFNKGVNEFEWTTPTTNNVITFKLLTHGDEQAIDQEVKGLKKINKDSSAELSTRLKYIILSVDGNNDKAAVREFVDNRFLARDSREFRKYLSKFQPDVDMRVFPEGGPEEGIELPIGVTFLWPDAGL